MMTEPILWSLVVFKFLCVCFVCDIAERERMMQLARLDCEEKIYADAN